jgi:alpha-tubulin suppressor-like RCC1 family protein
VGHTTNLLAPDTTNAGKVDLGTDLKAIGLVAYGGYFSCAIVQNTVTAAKSLKCWGENAWGQLGQGDTLNRGDGPGEMGDGLTAVSLGTGHTAAALAPGEYHTCALLDDHTVKCWGWNGSGQLGLGDTGNRGDALAEMGTPCLPEPGDGRTASAIAAGRAHTCALWTTAP